MMPFRRALQSRRLPRRDVLRKIGEYRPRRRRRRVDVRGAIEFDEHGQRARLLVGRGDERRELRRDLLLRRFDRLGVGARHGNARLAPVGAHVDARPDVGRHQHAADALEPDVRVLFWTDGDFADAAQTFRVHRDADDERRTRRLRGQRRELRRRQGGVADRGGGASFVADAEERSVAIVVVMLQRSGHVLRVAAEMQQRPAGRRAQVSRRFPARHRPPISLERRQTRPPKRGRFLLGQRPFEIQEGQRRGRAVLPRAHVAS
jgi:hypothetical protein